MNKYVKKYQESRSEGKSEYEAIGVAATFVSATGTIDDLRIVHDYFHQDLISNVDEWLLKAEKVTNKLNQLEESNYETA